MSAQDILLRRDPAVRLVSINPESKLRATNREVLNELIKFHGRTALSGKLPAYDGRKSLCTAGAVPFESEEFVVTLVEPEKEQKESVENENTITIRIAGRTDRHQLLRGKQRDMPQETIQGWEFGLEMLCQKTIHSDVDIYVVFPIDDKRTRQTVVQYFWDKHNYKLNYGSWPCLQAGSDSCLVYLRMEECNCSLFLLLKQAGGHTTVLERAFVRNGIPYVSEVPTIIFGADVTLPPPGEYSASSIAAVLASMDWPEITKYRGLVSAQPHRQEIIEDLSTVSKNPQKGHNVNGGMMRDGASEDQFSHVLLHEMDAIRKACASLEEGYLPSVTFMVVQKRHHSRLFHEVHGRRDVNHQSGNILPGMVVDHNIFHPSGLISIYAVMLVFRYAHCIPAVSVDRVRAGSPPNASIKTSQKGDTGHLVSLRSLITQLIEEQRWFEVVQIPLDLQLSKTYNGVSELLALRDDGACWVIGMLLDALEFKHELGLSFNGSFTIDDIWYNEYSKRIEINAKWEDIPLTQEAYMSDLAVVVLVLQQYFQYVGSSPLSKFPMFVADKKLFSKALRVGRPLYWDEAIPGGQNEMGIVLCYRTYDDDYYGRLDFTRCFITHVNGATGKQADAAVYVLAPKQLSELQWLLLVNYPAAQAAATPAADVSSVPSRLAPPLLSVWCPITARSLGSGPAETEEMSKELDDHCSPCAGTSRSLGSSAEMEEMSKELDDLRTDVEALAAQAQLRAKSDLADGLKHASAEQAVWLRNVRAEAAAGARRPPQPGSGTGNWRQQANSMIHTDLLSSFSQDGHVSSDI
ncbi:hypothetical protein HU200_025488 [Digitaria exilis]|uniref:Piwi domain-containing protein n=1 Tax=Digitaria exilis TaxID=1010633 RepID=A0A835BWM5_9POAL|nr:hypothetical protein HU200_025488 [Digitaria exilis]